MAEKNEPTSIDDARTQADEESRAAQAALESAGEVGSFFDKKEQKEEKEKILKFFQELGIDEKENNPGVITKAVIEGFLQRKNPDISPMSQECGAFCEELLYRDSLIKMRSDNEIKKDIESILIRIGRNDEENPAGPDTTIDRKQDTMQDTVLEESTEPLVGATSPVVEALPQKRVSEDKNKSIEKGDETGVEQELPVADREDEEGEKKYRELLDKIYEAIQLCQKYKDEFEGVSKRAVTYFSEKIDKYNAYRKICKQHQRAFLAAQESDWDVDREIETLEKNIEKLNNSADKAREAREEQRVLNKEAIDRVEQEAKLNNEKIYTGPEGRKQFDTERRDVAREEVLKEEWKSIVQSRWQNILDSHQGARYKNGKDEPDEGIFRKKFTDQVSELWANLESELGRKIDRSCIYGLLKADEATWNIDNIDIKKGWFRGKKVIIHRDEIRKTEEGESSVRLDVEKKEIPLKELDAFLIDRGEELQLEGKIQGKLDQKYEKAIERFKKRKSAILSQEVVSRATTMRELMHGLEISPARSSDAKYITNAQNIISRQFQDTERVPDIEALTEYLSGDSSPLSKVNDKVAKSQAVRFLLKEAEDRLRVEKINEATNLAQLVEALKSTGKSYRLDDTNLIEKFRKEKVKIKAEEIDRIEEAGDSEKLEEVLKRKGIMPEFRNKKTKEKFLALAMDALLKKYHEEKNKKDKRVSKKMGKAESLRSVENFDEFYSLMKQKQPNEQKTEVVKTIIENARKQVDDFFQDMDHVGKKAKIDPVIVKGLAGNPDLQSNVLRLLRLEAEKKFKNMLDSLSKGGKEIEVIDTNGTTIKFPPRFYVKLIKEGFNPSRAVERTMGFKVSIEIPLSKDPQSKRKISLDEMQTYEKLLEKGKSFRIEKR